MPQALTSAGFKSKARDLQGGSNGSGKSSSTLTAKREAKMKRLREITMNLIIAWGLSAVCGLTHALHALGASAPAWLKALNTMPVHAGLSAAALLGEYWLLLLS